MRCQQGSWQFPWRCGGGIAALGRWVRWGGRLAAAEGGLGMQRLRGVLGLCGVVWVWYGDS